MTLPINDLPYVALVDRCRIAQEQGLEVGEELARALCSHWHGGQGSAMYAFSSAGAYHRARLLEELSLTIAESYRAIPARERVALDMLGTYLINRRDS
jgi:hypothetical protein